jgi:quercetin 2,3-dioxygenase
MTRKEFIKGSAIVGMTMAVENIVNASGITNQATHRNVYQILNTQKTMVGTLPVLRAFAGDNNDYVSPYVFFDEFGPVKLEPQHEPLRVEAHPHAGVVPTTYFLNGNGHHRDSLNYDFQIGKGDFMMFSSGRGAIHSEATGQGLYDNGGIYHGFQIWLNMPSKFKFIDPSTNIFNNEKMNVYTSQNVEAKVVLGSLYDKKSSIETLSPTFYFHIKIAANTIFEIPVDETHNAFIYLISGELELAEQRKLQKNQVALFERGKNTIKVFAKEEVEFLCLGGEPLNEVVYAYGPFVMNTEAQIRDCYTNYRLGKMGDPMQVNGHK